MAKPYVLAIDQGTSSTKCLLVDAAGQVVSRGSAPLGETYPQPGWVDQDPLAILASVRQAVQQCLQGQDPQAVAAVGLSNQRESTVAWQRATGQPLAPLISWQDQRTAAVCDRRRTSNVEQWVRQTSGLPLDPMFSAAKACWLLDAVDPDRRAARAGDLCLGTVDAWLLSQLCGVHATDAGNASRTQLMDVHALAWDDELLALFNVPRAALPDIRPSGGAFGSLRGLAPLPDGVPVLAVMGDSHSALFAHGAFEPGDVKATLGTGSSVMGLIAPDRRQASSGLCLTIGWQLQQTAYAAEGNIRSCGATLRWLSQLFGVSPEQLAAEAATRQPGDLQLVPGFNGLGAPWWDDQAVGLISGLTLGTDRAALACAALDSMVQQVADLVDVIDADFGGVQRLHVDGGPTRNDALMQRLADLVGRPVLRSRQAELSALGAAHLAALQAGLLTWDGLRALDRQVDRFEPQGNDARRHAARAPWRHAVERARLRKA